MCVKSRTVSVCEEQDCGGVGVKSRTVCVCVCVCVLRAGLRL